jgi:hypothetical protein
LRLLEHLFGAIAEIGGFFAMVFCIVLLFRQQAAATRRRREYKQSWVRALVGGCADAVRYFFIRVASIADQADRSVRTSRTTTGNGADGSGTCCGSAWWGS